MTRDVIRMCSVARLVLLLLLSAAGEVISEFTSNHLFFSWAVSDIPMTVTSGKKKNKKQKNQCQYISDINFCFLARNDYCDT